MIIRQEQQGDHSAIADVTTSAFLGVEHSDQTEAAIVARLREANALTLSLVAVESDTIIGHIAFSPALIDGTACGWFGLGPVSVRPDRQNDGIGTALIKRGLADLRSRGAVGCVLLGEPAFYRCFGFEPDDGLSYADAPPEFFLRLNLIGRAAPSGSVAYHPAFTVG